MLGMSWWIAKNERLGRSPQLQDTHSKFQLECAKDSSPNKGEIRDSKGYDSIVVKVLLPVRLRHSQSISISSKR